MGITPLVPSWNLLRTLLCEVAVEFTNRVLVRQYLWWHRYQCTLWSVAQGWYCCNVSLFSCRSKDFFSGIEF